jgi:hypothetical protein
MHRRHFVNASLASAALAGLPGMRLLAAVADVRSDVNARRLDGGETTIPRSAVREFRGSLRGALLLPGEEGYEPARRVWNGMIDRRPALIARCAGAADVISAVSFARAHDLLVAVRGGGHSVSGQSVCDGGLLVDLSPMRYVQVDPVARTARAGPGTLLGDLDREARAFRLATTAGTVSHTGAAGLTLGGGFGRLGRRFGLTCDNLLSADVVTAAGDLLTASASENPDLFWALRGGGGNFGIVTSFEYQLHDVDPIILGGPIMFPFDRARDVLRFYAEHTQGLPDELNLDVVIVAPPGARPMVAMEACYSGPDKRRGEELLQPVRTFAKPMLDRIRLMPYVELQTAADAANAPGQHYYVKSGFVREVSRDLIDAMVEGYRPDPGRATVLILQQLGGAIGRVRPDATAFAQRDAAYDLMPLAGWRDAAADDTHAGWIRDFWQTLQGYTSGFYVNTSTDTDDQARVRATYGDNYARLAQLKARYDPGNRFRLNANIRPAG